MKKKNKIKNKKHQQQFKEVAQVCEIELFNEFCCLLFSLVE